MASDGDKGVAHRPAPLVEMTLQEGLGPERAGGAAVAAVALEAGVPSDRVSGLQALVEELVRESLAREHAGPPKVRLAVSVEGARLEAELCDEALPVSARETRRLPSRRLAAAGLADELHIAAHGRDGNIARCAVALAPGVSEESAALADERLPEDAALADEDLAAGLEIRPMRESDAAELVRCIYRTYGYSYKSALMYEPREIVRALRRGQMHSVVATTPAAGVVGHMAIFFERPGDAIPEAGRLVVDPRFRGHGIAGRMAKARLEMAIERKLPGFWSEAVTNHPYSQREVIAEGGAEVGLLIGGSPPIAGMVGFDEASATLRGTLMAAYTPLAPTAETVHVPERHAEMLGELIDRLGLEREIAHGAEPEATAKTKLTSSVEPAYGLASLRVHAVGADVHDHVADQLEALEAFDIGVVQLDLPLSDPGTPMAAEALERLGFCFAAWMPRFEEGSDGLRLQRIGSHPVETEVVCARPEGEALRDYVFAEWHRVRRL